jgi:IS1 family transposase
LGRKHAQQAGPDGESTEWSEDGRQWVWISFAPEFRRILAAFVGPRTFASALRLIEMRAAVVLGVPCFFSDGFSCYLSALIDVYHTLKTFPRTGTQTAVRRRQQRTAARPTIMRGEGWPLTCSEQSLGRRACATGRADHEIASAHAGAQDVSQWLRTASVGSFVTRAP